MRDPTDHATGPDLPFEENAEDPPARFHVLRDHEKGRQGGKVIDLVAVRVVRRKEPEERPQQRETAERAPDGEITGSSGSDERPSCDGDNRRYPRRATRLRIGKVADVGERFLAECAIRDVSHGGAKLIVSAKVDLPHVVILHDEVEDAIIPARICWRRGNEAGVSFDVPAAKVTGLKPDRLRARLRKLYEMDD